MNRPEMHTRPDARRSVVRSAMVWTPIFVASTALAVAFAIIALDSAGAWVSFAIAALIALLSGVSATGALRDLFAEPIQTQGVIDRKWRKSDVLVFRGHYILCRKRVFRIPGEIFAEMPDVGGSVLLEHYPHTSALTAWAAVAAPASEDSADTDETAGHSGDGEERETVSSGVPGSRASIVDGDGGTPMPPPASTGITSERPIEPELPRTRVEPPRFGAPPPDDDPESRR